MRCSYACNSPEHDVSRRQFLSGIAGGLGGLGALGLGGMIQPLLAGDLHKKKRQVLMVWLSGGVSQLETWDPKPGTDTGGPFQAIPTSVTGTHICELLPYTAKQMHRIALIRGINTVEDDHGKGAYIMHTGRRPEPRLQYPHLGSVCAKLLTPPHHPLPGYIHVSPRGAGGFGKQDAAFLGPKYASVILGDGKPPANLLRPPALTEEADQKRNAFRAHLNQRFNQRRRTAETEVYSQAYEQAAQLMKRQDLFDIAKENPKDADRYGAHDFGRHCLLARRLLDNGVPFVKVTHTNYDTHHENFDFHIEQLGDFDRPFASLLDDLDQRGLLSTTLVVVMSEFGRTPKINRNYGRDHWSRAWSIALAGCGIKGGTVVGKTNANGTAVTDRQVHGGHLFHTYLTALGINSEKNHYINGRPIPIADPKASPIQEVWHDRPVWPRSNGPRRLHGSIPMPAAALKPAPAPAQAGPLQTHLVQELKHTSPLIGCRLDATGRFVFAGAQDNTIQRWELATGKKSALAGHKSWVRAILCPADGKLLLTGDYTGKVIWWPADAGSPAPIRTVQAHRGWARALAVSPDGQTVATCGNDLLVKLWSLADGKTVREFAGHASHVYNVAFHPGGRFLVSADLLGIVKQWDLATGKMVRKMDATILHKYDTSFRADHGGARGMSFNAEGGLLACCGITDVSNAFAGIGKPLVVLFDWQTGKTRLLLRPKENFVGTAWGVSFLPSGDVVSVGGGQGGTLWFWKPGQAQSYHTVKLPNNARDLSLHPDRRRLAVACSDGAVRIYDMGAKKPV